MQSLQAEVKTQQSLRVELERCRKELKSFEGTLHENVDQKVWVIDLRNGNVELR